MHGSPGAPIMQQSERSVSRDTSAGGTQFGDSSIGSKQGPHHWQKSPVWTTSLLPPFGSTTLPSHLPTPQSPGNLVGYLTGLAESPQLSDGSRPGPSRQLTHYPSLSPESAKLPKTLQHELNPSTSSVPSRTFPVPFQVDGLDQAGVDYAKFPPSQVATPSPEIARRSRISSTNTLTDPDTPTLSSTAKPSSRNDYGEITPLAPAPIISSPGQPYPTAYHAYPEFLSGKRQTFGVSKDISHDVLDTKPETSDLADPFVITGNEVRNRPPSIPRYSSPPIAMDRDKLGQRRSVTPIPQFHSEKNPAAVPILFPPMSPEARASVKTEDDKYEIRADTPQRQLSLEQPVYRTPPAAGGEMQRIRQHQADLAATRLAESEKHRPDYLVRAKRMREDGLGDETWQSERDEVFPRLGVTVTPVRGRRLELYRPVPVKGRVSSLDDLSDVDAEPKTPPPADTMTTHASVPAMSMRAIEWRTPKQRRTSPVALSHEDELKKRKRLAAFAVTEPSGSGRRLKPVDVPGHGRMVVDVTSDDARALAEAGIIAMPLPDSTEYEEEVNHAEWPDSEYPWYLQSQRRIKEKEAERRQRLFWIERFLERDSESEGDDLEPTAGPSWRNSPPEVMSPPYGERGRGKYVSLETTSKSWNAHVNGQSTFRAANADARKVLLSKRHVREVAERIRQRKAAKEEEGAVMCICQGEDDGRAMVRCDQCRGWYHLACMDISDESELGDEWFCFRCTPSADPAPAPLFEPTFAPVAPDTPPRTSVRDLPLYQTSLQPSPMLEVRARAPLSPSMPPDRERSPSRRSRFPNYLGDDPFRGSPSTPYHGQTTESRLYSYSGEDHVPFDPTSTPSRGLKFPNPVPITPRRAPAWTGGGQQGLFWGAAAAATTPSSGIPRSPPQFSSAARSLAYSLSTTDDSSVGPLTSPWPGGDDSPTRMPPRQQKTSAAAHDQPPGFFTYPTPRRLFDSPLVARGGIPPGVEESPTARYTAAHHRSRERDHPGESGVVPPPRTSSGPGQSPFRK